MINVRSDEITTLSESEKSTILVQVKTRVNLTITLAVIAIIITALDIALQYFKVI